MPNWVYNSLKITGKPEKIREIKDRAYFNGLVFNFRAFVSIDRSKDSDDLRIELWGTDRNAVDSKIVDEEPGSIRYTFSTAWAPPEKFVASLRELYPDVEFDLDYVCEMNNEEFIDESIYDDESIDNAESEECETSDGETENENLNGFILCADDPTSGEGFVEWLESTERDEALSKKDEFRNFIMMGDKNIEKFKTLYGVGRRKGKDAFLETLFSFSRIIPEPIKDTSDKNWIDNSGQDLWSFKKHKWKHTDSNEGNVSEPVVGRDLEIWRYDNWGTSSDALYDSCEEPFGLDLWGYVPKENEIPVIRPLDELLKGEYVFYTLCKPPINIYMKMAADGLIFEVTWRSDVWNEWAVGKGQAVDGRFEYHVGPITGGDILQLRSVAFSFIDSERECPDYRPTIGVISRAHLDQLIEELQENLKTELYFHNELFDPKKIVEGNTVILDRTLDLNFFSISSDITDLSNLFANFDVSPRPEEGWFCKIKIDVSRWDVSNVTKMGNLFNRERVDLVNLSRWDRPK